LLVLLLLLGACAESPNGQYRRGEVRQAAERYARAVEEGDTSRVARYNLGTALLRLRRFDEARTQLAAAVPGSDRMLGERAHYNIGNTDLEPAFSDSSENPDRAEPLRRAIAQYKRALLLDPADRDAKWNLELAQRLLGDPPRSDGGGGGGEDDSGGGEDDQDKGPPQPAPGPPQPTRSSAGPGDPNLSRGEAESILSAAERDERELQRHKLREAPPGQRAARDW
jgi:tetratricopeptide (TPR) repeat protein